MINNVMAVSLAPIRSYILWPVHDIRTSTNSRRNGNPTERLTTCACSLLIVTHGAHFIGRSYPYKGYSYPSSIGKAFRGFRAKDAQRFLGIVRMISC